MDTNYGVCKFCGAKNAFNPKTQKIFCSAKCWLKETKVESLNPNGTEKVSSDKVQDNINWSVSVNNSCELVSAMISHGDIGGKEEIKGLIKEYAEYLYNLK